MTVCSNCEKKFSLWNSYSIEGIDGTYCEDCYKKYKHEIIKKKEEKTRNIVKRGENKISEYKRKCNQCGKIWHSLRSKENQLRTKGLLDSIIGIGTAIQGNLGASTQSSRKQKHHPN